MIPVVLIDQLLINTVGHEKIMNVLVNYCIFMRNLEIQNGMSK